MKSEEEVTNAIEALHLVYDMTLGKDKYKALSAQIDALKWVVGD